MNVLYMGELAGVRIRESKMPAEQFPVSEAWVRVAKTHKTELSSRCWEGVVQHSRIEGPWYELSTSSRINMADAHVLVFAARHFQHERGIRLQLLSLISMLSKHGSSIL